MRSHLFFLSSSGFRVVSWLLGALDLSGCDATMSGLGACILVWIGARDARRAINKIAKKQTTIPTNTRIKTPCSPVFGTGEYCHDAKEGTLVSPARYMTTRNKKYGV